MQSPNAFDSATPVRVRTRGVSLSARVLGKLDGPTLFLVHGYPDTSAVWSLIASELADRYRIITYDVRGAGASDRPTNTADYRFAELVADAHAVLDVLAPNTRVHLVGHDWGSIQGWEFVSSAGSETFASFTSISGPCLDHFGWLMREAIGRGKSERVESPRGERRRILRGQLMKSWYILVLTRPKLAAALWRRGLAAKFTEDLERFEGFTPGHGHPASTLAEDGAFGAMLYAANMIERARSPRPDPSASLPIQMIVPERDRFVSPSAPDVARSYASDLRVSRLDAGHWCLRSRPSDIANLVDRFVRDVESRKR